MDRPAAGADRIGSLSKEPTIAAAETQSDQPAVRARGLGKRYALYRRPADRILDVFGLLRFVPGGRASVGAFWAVRDLGLTVAKGERLGIIGRNGAGKSTLLKMIAGSLSPTEGELSIDGEVQAMLELGTGFHPEFTGRRNIRASLGFRGLNSEQVAELEPEIIDFSELDEFIDRPVKTYSAGMYARLAFSVATAVDPEILIIDEVLGAGDAYFAGKCVGRMRDITERSGATVLFVSHDLSSVQHLCDRAIWIDRGRVIRDGEPLTVIQAYQEVVREEDEARLRARDRRVLKKHEGGGADESTYERLLFHFVGDGAPPPKPKTLISRISLRFGEDEVAAIDVGAAMDNDPTQPNHLLDTAGYMDWGPPERAGSDRARAVHDRGGRFHHAPFELAVPRSYLASGAPAALELDAEPGDEPLVVELFRNEAYQRVGVIEPGAARPIRLPISHALLMSTPASEDGSKNAEHAAPEPTEPRAPKTDYGSGEARITGVRLCDEAGRETKVLTATRLARVEIDFEADRRLENPVFAFAVYLPDGRPATQALVATADLGTPEIPKGPGRIVLEMDPLRLGRGSYVASAAIFKRLRPDGLEPEGYHVLDRCIHFQIEQPRDAVYELGLCVQPVRARVESIDQRSERTPAGFEPGSKSG